jgi:hypothetical protein
MAALPVYETQKGFNRHALAYIDEMVIQGVLTDAIINPLTTVAGLRAVSFSGYETSRRFYEQYQKLIDYAESIGVLTDARVAAADTAAGLEVLFTQEDSTISITGNKSLVAA